jgi:hypothetical protein
MFQTLALQQMGKLTSPITGKVERDLHQSRITVDMLEMIRKRTEGNLEENEKKLLDSVIMELQMNYIDEQTRADEEGGEEGPKETESEGEDSGGGDGEDEHGGDV